MHARKAAPSDVETICRICADAWRETYRELYSRERIDKVIAEFYSPDRVRAELEPGEAWDGWWVAEDDAGTVVAAGGGGITGPQVGEIYVLYADPARRGKGARTAILEAITHEQRAQGATEQSVAVAEGNEKGIPFYEARGFRRRGTRPAYASEDSSEPDSALFWRPVR